MKVIDINKKSIKKISNKELLNMHRRTHMLYFSNIKNSDLSKTLIEKHNMLANEMKSRGFSHNSPLQTVRNMKMVEHYISMLSLLEEIR